MLNGLRAEGVEPVLVIWALAREARSLDGLRSKLEKGQGIDQIHNHPAIPKKRVPVLRAALRRHNLTSKLELTNLLRTADQPVKGAGGDTWQHLSNACHLLSSQQST